MAAGCRKGELKSIGQLGPLSGPGKKKKPANKGRPNTKRLDAWESHGPAIVAALLLSK